VRTSLVAIALMALLLSGGSWRQSRLLQALRKPAGRLRRLHNGHVPDYVAWMMVGAAMVGMWMMAIVGGL
jgi:hypothetical protein